jgi:CBS domain containing-hemolysin-like protein
MSGLVKNSESKIIQNLFRLSELKVADIMTPRTVIAALREDETVAEALPSARGAQFSRLPVYHVDIDAITGFVLRDDILLRAGDGREAEPLKSFKREILAVPEMLSLSLLMEQFLKQREHIALAVDEFGGTMGLVTLEDLLETLIGVEIVDERDKTDDMRRLARSLWASRMRSRGIEIDGESPSSGAPSGSGE